MDCWIVFDLIVYHWWWTAFTGVAIVQPRELLVRITDQLWVWETQRSVNPKDAMIMRLLPLSGRITAKKSNALYGLEKHKDHLNFFLSPFLNSSSRSSNNSVDSYTTRAPTTSTRPSLDCWILHGRRSYHKDCGERNPFEHKSDQN